MRIKINSPIALNQKVLTYNGSVENHDVYMVGDDEFLKFILINECVVWVEKDEEGYYII